MAHIIAQHTIQSVTGVPANAVTNVFHFLTPGAVPLSPELDDIVNAVEQFYDDVTPFGQKVSSLLSAVALTVADARIKLYNAADPKPRAPLRNVTRNMPGFGLGGHPNEVAVVLSFRSATPSGALLRRRRGRIYLGPLSDQASFVEDLAGDVRPSVTVRTTIAEAADRLISDVLTQWATHSTVDNVTSPVTSGFVDNAYDTQRRRGTVGTARHVFP